MKSKGIVIGIFVIFVVVILGFVLFSNKNDSFEQQPKNSVFWMDLELKDVNTGETFKISEFNKPVLLESFAVWCPTCTKQQIELKKLHDLPGFSEEEVISISLDTDPNEDENKIREHSQSNGFNWRYAISPTDLTKQLIDEFGPSIVNAPSAPIVLICPDGNFHQLSSSRVKSVQDLQDAIASCGN